mmetsp:Transcript_11422/g.47893  ORF Transcript_11422/g.47893 Transcript_11422/m.47893 type:complete len:289 (+) Transcript_11422:3092-3958(+)
MHDRLRRELLGVLLAHADHDLQILARVRDEQLLDALQRPLRAERAEPLDERLRVDAVRVHAAPLQIGNLRVVLQRAHVQASLLAELRDARAVVMRQLALAENRVGDVRERHQVDLQHLRLHASLLFVVLLEHVQQKTGGLADHVPLQEQVRHRVGVHRRRVLLANLNRNLHRALRVAHKRGLQHVRVVGLVPGHLAVLAHLLELALLRERGHHLAVGLGLDVHAQRHVGVDALEQVAELLRALELVLRHPRVQQLLLVLRQHQLRQLHRLERVELAALQADPEVLQQR